jgi:LPXTG-motif cell wall-anchored protein
VSRAVEGDGGTPRRLRERAETMTYRWILFATMLTAGVILGIAAATLPDHYGEMIDNHSTPILVGLMIIVLGVLGWWKRRRDRRAPTIPE